ncbi:MAG: MarR family transcriptional regulator [Planctomycetota bacterium]
MREHGESRVEAAELLRNSHIFSSLVREILEEKYLREITPNSINLSQFHLLKAITLNESRPAGELAGFLGVTPPAATKALDKLEGLGLVARSSSPRDRRVRLLSPSEKGRELVRAYEELKADRLAPVLDKFETEEIEQLAELLQRFSLRLLRQEAADDGICLRCAAYCEDHCPVGDVTGGCPYVELRSNGTPEAGST